MGLCENFTFNCFTIFKSIWIFCSQSKECSCLPSCWWTVACYNQWLNVPQNCSLLIFYRSLDTSVASVLFESFFETSPLLIWNSPIFTKSAILELKNWTYTLSPCVLFSMSVDGFHSPSATSDAKLNKLTSFLGLFTLRVIQFRPRGFVKWKLVEKVSARANSSLQILKTLKTRLV